jgi:hypothetical protein
MHGGGVVDGFFPHHDDDHDHAIINAHFQADLQQLFGEDDEDEEVDRSLEMMYNEMDNEMEISGNDEDGYNVN